MSLKALVVIVVLLATLANIEAASLTASSSASWSVSVTGSVSGTVSVSYSNTVSVSYSNSVSNSVSGSVSPSVSASPESTANVDNLENTCSGRPLIICLKWTSTSASKFVVTVGSKSWTYASNIRKVDLVDLSPNTNYLIEIVAIDAAGRESEADSLSVTTGAESPKSNPETKGPQSLACVQIADSASVKATWTLPVVPTRVQLKVKCAGNRNRNVNISPPSKTTINVASVFGKKKADATINCTCKLRAFYTKGSIKNYKIPFKTTKFTVDTSQI